MSVHEITETLPAQLVCPMAMDAGRAETLTASAKGVRHYSAADRFFRSVVLGKLQHIKHGQLVMQDAMGQSDFGSGSCGDLAVRLRVQSQAFYRRVAAAGALGAAESYLANEWTCDNLTAFFRIMLQNETALKQVQSWTTMFGRMLGRLQHLKNQNSREGSRRNIHEHYDLGNEFFQLFLDNSMMYSSALFSDPVTPLEEASWAKVDRVCRSLKLSADDHVVEIGTGWGGFALHAAKHYGCRVTTTTISDEQYSFASRRISDAGLSDRVTLLKQDYRDLSGKYDKLVSLEMIEAVGREFLPGYFAKCNSLLKNDGAMLIQAITMPEQRYDQYCRSVDFIQKYIFPGGFLPSVSEMQKCVQQQTSLRLVDLFDFGLHYARTLQIWNERFHDRLEDVRCQGFSERFIRMWRYYLCYCEAAFLERATGVVQAIWAMPKSTLGGGCLGS